MHLQSKRGFPILAAIAALLAAACCASAAQVRPCVGLLPFDPPQSEKGRLSALTHTIPGLLGWELYFIPGVDQCRMPSMVACMHLDELARPKHLDSVRAYSRLARRLGVDYLVTGRTGPIRSSAASFVVVVYSAADPDFRLRIARRATVESLPRCLRETAVRLATSIGVSTTADPSPRPSGSLEALQAIEEALRRRMRKDAGSSDMEAAMRAAIRAARELDGGPFAAMLALEHWAWSIEKIRRIEKIAKQARDNLFVISQIVQGCKEIGDRSRATPYSLKWLRLDPTSPLARMAAADSMITAPTPLTPGKKRQQPGSSPFNKGGHKRVVSAVSEEVGYTGSPFAWRSELDYIELYSLMRDPTKNQARMRKTREMLRRVKTRYPDSAYVRAFAGRVHSDRGRHPEAAAEYAEAVRINPRSLRLRWLLADAYLSDGKVDEAMQVAKSMIGRWPRRAEGHLLASRVYYRQGLRKEGMAELETAREIDPELDMDHRLLGREYLRSGRVVEAFREFARGNPGVRRGIIIAALVMTGVFLLAVVSLAVVLRYALAPEKRRG